MASVLVTHTEHFVRGPDGHVYAPNALLDHAFFERYLTVYDKVGVAVRVRRADTVPEPGYRADGPGIEFRDLPDYLGPWQYLRSRGLISAVLREIVPLYDTFCLRVPCAIGTMLWRELRRRGRPFGAEVVGDPWDSLGPGSVRSLARPLARRLAARDLRAQCHSAIATAYVTRESLQRRYPPGPDTYTTHYSSIELPPDALIDAARAEFAQPGRIIYVGTLAVLYKAPDVLIEAFARLGRADLDLILAGDGRERPQLESLADSLGVAGQTTFLGKIPAGTGVRAALDAADLFVLPSRQEGLPRAMIEAMARGLPCIGSTAGGIPELLPPEDLVPPDDSAALAGKIAEFLDNPQRMQAAAARNRKVAAEYLAPVLAQRRREFYTQLLTIGSH